MQEWTWFKSVQSESKSIFLSDAYSNEDASMSAIDKIGKRNTLILILFSNRHNKSEIGCNESLFGLLSLFAASMDRLCK